MGWIRTSAHDLVANIGAAKQKSTQPWGLWPYKVYDPGDPSNGKWIYRETLPAGVTGSNRFQFGNYYSAYQGRYPRSKSANHKTTQSVVFIYKLTAMKFTKYRLDCYCASLWYLSCKKDNYEAPSSTLSGRLVYGGDSIGLEKDQVPFELYQYGFGKVGALGATFTPEGRYSALLFDGEYKMIIPTSQGPFLSMSQWIRRPRFPFNHSKGQSDTRS